MDQVGDSYPRALAAPDNETALAEVKRDVEALCARFPLYACAQPDRYEPDASFGPLSALRRHPAGGRLAPLRRQPGWYALLAAHPDQRRPTSRR